MAKTRSRVRTKSAAAAKRSPIRKALASAKTGLQRRSRAGSRAVRKAARSAARYPGGRFVALAGGVLAVGGLAAAAYAMFGGGPERREKVMGRMRDMRSKAMSFMSAPPPDEHAEAAAAAVH